MFGLGFFEIIIILVVILVVVGPEKLPHFAQTLGRTLWQLRRAAEDFKNDVSESGFTFDANSIRKEVNELKSLLLDDGRRLANQIIPPPAQLEPPSTSLPQNPRNTASEAQADDQTGDNSQSEDTDGRPTAPTLSNDTPPDAILAPTNDTVKE